LRHVERFDLALDVFSIDRLVIRDLQFEQRNVLLWLQCAELFLRPGNSLRPAAVVELTLPVPDRLRETIRLLPRLAGLGLVARPRAIISRGRCLRLGRGCTFLSRRLLRREAVDL